jgi:hypothetical protein
VVRRAALITAAALAALAIAACGAEGIAPTISNLVVTSSVARGATGNGSVDVEDPDGMAGLNLELALQGPTPVTITVPVLNATEETFRSSVPFVFQLTTAAEAGVYTISVTAIDGEGLRSHTLTSSLTAR